MEIFWSVPSAVSSSILLLPLFFYLSSSVSGSSLAQITKKGDPPLSNFNPRSISNQQHYIGNHQNLLKEKKANFRGLYISVRDPLIDWCVNTGLKQQQHGEERRGKGRLCLFMRIRYFLQQMAARGAQFHIRQSVQSCRVQAKVSNCTSSSVSIRQSCSPHTFVFQYKGLIKGAR